MLYVKQPVYKANEPNKQCPFLNDMILNGVEEKSFHAGIIFIRLQKTFQMVWEILNVERSLKQWQKSRGSFENVLTD